MGRHEAIAAAAIEMLQDAIGGVPVVPHGRDTRRKDIGASGGPPSSRVFSIHPRRGRVGLAMIVRDEALVIERCLRSVMHLIDTWTIVDTGSVDGTPDIVRSLLADRPGALHQRPWRDFAANRNELLDLAAGTADHLLLLDADIEVVADGFDPDQLTDDAHDVEVRESVTYRMPYIVRSTAPWYYRGRTHEYLTSDETLSSSFLPTLVFRHHADGGSRGDKYERDRRLLEATLREDPDDARALFYLAQTRQALGEAGGALAAFRRRIEHGGWEEEVFWSLYQCGRILEGRGEWTSAAQAYLSAWEYRPTRAEPLFRLAQGYRSRHMHEIGFMFATRASTLRIPDDRLFVERWMYEWGVDFERSVLAWWVGERELARTLTHGLLGRHDLPPEYRAALESNVTFVDP